MKYADFIKRERNCPFCAGCLDGVSRVQVIHRLKHAALLVSIAPYTRDHVLIVPVRHITNLESLSPAEIKQFQTLMRLGVRLLKKRGHSAYTILARQGDESSKSVPHVHAHLIPDLVITNKEHASARRPVRSQKQCATLVKEYQTLLSL